jgi:predicted nucleotidyltransferase component of viral defense system
MTVEGKAASVHDRLLAKARASGSDFNLLLTRYSLERFLYRLSASSYQERFLLKGALLFGLWYDMPRRPTRDADLLGLQSMEREEMAAIFRSICSIPCEDGMRFLAESVQAAEIREDARYGGIRIDLVGMLGNARCPIQIDIGYGDVVTPDPELVRYPPILEDNPVPILKAYPRETVLAEKLEAIVSLGMANSRMKDFFDLQVLIQDYPSDRRLAAEAILRTFERRGTPIPDSLPIGLSDEFAKDRTKQVQWKAFLTKNKLEALELGKVVAIVREFWLGVIG